MQPCSQSFFYLRDGGWICVSLARWLTQGTSISKPADSSCCKRKEETWIHLLFQMKGWELLIEAGQRPRQRGRNFHPRNQTSLTLPSSFPRGLNTWIKHLARGYTFSWQGGISTSLTGSALLILDLLRIYLNVRDDISLSQGSWKEEFPAP